LNGQRSRGLTLIELTVSSAIMASVVVIVLFVSGIVGDSLAVNGRASELAERTQITRRIAGFLRGASVGALEVPSGGGWASPIDGTAYSTLRFRSVVGLPTESSEALGLSRTLAFVRDSGETANGTDDDGDGLVDEGEIRLVEASGSGAALATAVEVFTITKTGRNLQIMVRIGGRAGRKELHDSALLVPVLLRNN